MFVIFVVVRSKKIKNTTVICFGFRNLCILAQKIVALLMKKMYLCLLDPILTNTFFHEGYLLIFFFFVRILRNLKRYF